MPPLSRRDFLRAGAGAALGAFAVACGRGDGGGGGGAPGSLNDVIRGRAQSLQAIIAPFETFAGQPQRVVIGLRNPSTGAFLQGGDARVWAAQDREADALGPFPLTFRGDGLGERGVYVTEATFPAEGQWLMVIEATPAGDPDELIGAGFLQVGPQTNMPKPGDEAISVATPTFDDDRGVDPICTLGPPICSMHATSLDEALQTGKPTVLIIATPRFCTSALCGPEVLILDEIAADLGERANFVHIELLKDATNETAEAWARAPHPNLFAPGAAAWRVEQEPVIYFIDDGATIAERVIGPFDRTEAREKIQALVGA